MGRVRNKRARQFKMACRCGDLSYISHLIAEDGFDVNDSLYPFHDKLPLLVAIEERNLPIISLLLDNGADPNADGGHPLFQAITLADPELVRLLLDHGADPNAGNDGELLEKAVSQSQINVVRLLLERGADPRNILTSAKSTVWFGTGKDQIVRLLFYRAGQLVNSDNIIETMRRFKKCFQLCQAILNQDEAQVNQLLQNDDYESYAGILGDRYRPTRIAFLLGGVTIVKAFVNANLDLESIFWMAVGTGNLAILELCLTSSNFNPCIQNHHGQTALHVACSFIQFEVIKVLVDRYGLCLDACDSAGLTPLFYIHEPELLRRLLATFPETNTNVMSDQGERLLCFKSGSCGIYAALLEYGVNPDQNNFIDRGNTSIHICIRHPCPVVRYLQKMMLLDSSYVHSIIKLVLPFDMNQFIELENPDLLEYKTEFARMQSIRISQSTSSVAGKTLLDFIFLNANEAARYSRNEVIISLYEEHGEDFQKCLPHYGFALNYRLRRGMVRRKLIDSAHDLFCSLVGVGIPEALTELVFEYFSNGALKHFSLETITN